MKGPRNVPFSSASRAHWLKDTLPGIQIKGGHKEKCASPLQRPLLKPPRYPKYLFRANLILRVGRDSGMPKRHAMNGRPA